ncbi:hypothetical protein HKD37_05G012623 [Glycine soja]
MYAPLELIHKRCTLSCSQYYDPSRCTLYLYHKRWKRKNQKNSQEVSPLNLLARERRKNRKNSQAIRCSSDENSVEDDKDGGIGAGDAPVAPKHDVLCAAAEVDEPLRFLDDSTIW